MSVEQIGYNGPDGMTMGATSTEPIGFYGATPVTRYVGAGAASTYATTTNTVTTMAGFVSRAALNDFVAQVSTLTVACRNLGLID